jgi:hypothetical protein
MTKSLPALVLTLITVFVAAGCGNDDPRPGEADLNRPTPNATATAATATATATTSTTATAAGATATPTPRPAGAPASPTGAGFILRMSGTEGVAFAGECESGTTPAGMTTQPVAGTVPAELELPGNRLRCTLRHRSATGTLRVQVSRGGQVVNTSETSAGGEIQFQLALP